MSLGLEEKAENKGKEYTMAGYNLIAICLIWGICDAKRLAQVLGRKNEQCIWAAFRRVCKNESAYFGKDYPIKPPVYGYKKDILNEAGKMYVKEQHEIGVSAEQMSERIGVELEAIKDYINE